MPRQDWDEPQTPPGGAPLHPDPLLHALLAARGFDQAAVAAFLADDPYAAPDPLRMPGMAGAVDRVDRAIRIREPIAVYGDYDVDGISATALLVRAVQAATAGAARIEPWLPTRAEGYGLNRPAVEAIAAGGARLLVVVDCGSGEHERIAVAQALGLDVVVLDHHQMPGPPPAGAWVASAQLEPDAPYQELTAAGVAFLLAVGLARRGHDAGDGPGRDPVGLLDLATLGTIGDVAPLTGANRPLVRAGLAAMRERPRLGLRMLCRRAGVEPAGLTSEAIAFKLAPRLNAAGRMADPRLALDLLLSDDPAEAARLANDLERLNQRRRAESQRIVAEAEGLARRYPDLAERPLLVLASPGWGTGVVGLAAGKLAERFRRPVLVLNEENGLSRGSARSVPGFDIARALARCEHLLEAHGGHSQAAGLTVRSDARPELERALALEVAASDLGAPAAPSLRIDADLPAARLEAKTAALLDRLQPFGAGNPLPLLRVRDVAVRSYNTIGQDNSHLKLHLETPGGVVQALAWGAAARSHELLAQPRIDLVATVGFDHWNGQCRLHVEVKDFDGAE